MDLRTGNCHFCKNSDAFRDTISNRRRTHWVPSDPQLRDTKWKGILECDVTSPVKLKHLLEVRGSFLIYVQNI